jgi:hypothetical protein
MRSAAALVALLALGAAIVLAPPAAARPTGCAAGVKSSGGLTERTFCGSAKATVHYGAQTLKFSNGDCTKTAQYISVNIGTVVLGTTTKPKPDYFGLDVGRLPGSTGKAAGKDGTYAGGVLALAHGVKTYLVVPNTLKIVLSGGRTHGTFSGTGFGGSAPKVTGTFSC